MLHGASAHSTQMVQLYFLNGCVAVSRCLVKTKLNMNAYSFNHLSNCKILEWKKKSPNNYNCNYNKTLTALAKKTTQSQISLLVTKRFSLQKKKSQVLFHMMDGIPYDKLS